MKTTRKLVRLSRKTAEKIIRQYIAPGLTVAQASSSTDAKIYLANTGAFEIQCQNDWYDQCGRIHLSIHDRLGGAALSLYIDPATLERDNVLEEERRRQEANDRIRSATSW